MSTITNCEKCGKSTPYSRTGPQLCWSCQNPKTTYLEEIKERCNAATPGPWEGSKQRVYDVIGPIPKDIYPDPVDLEWHGGFPIAEVSRRHPGNATFIAHSRVDIPTSWI